MSRRGGIIQLTVGGVLHECKGNFTYNLGAPKNESIIGSSGRTGHKATPQAAFIEGMLTDSPSFSFTDLVNAENVTVHLKLATGKVIIMSSATYCGDGNGSTDEGELTFRFEADFAEEILA